MRTKIERDPEDGLVPPDAVVREIDENLKRVYREVVEEGVPDRFASLLAALRAKETGGGAGGR